MFEGLRGLFSFVMGTDNNAERDEVERWVTGILRLAAIRSWKRMRVVIRHDVADSRLLKAVIEEPSRSSDHISPIEAQQFDKVIQHLKSLAPQRSKQKDSHPGTISHARFWYKADAHPLQVDAVFRLNGEGSITLTITPILSS